MNNKKICFIICVNNDKYIEECLYYINRLNVPEGYTVEVLTVREAHSMASGYNAAMKESDAKYKIYIHQDVFLIKKDIICSLIEIFEDKNIGMIGVVGTQNMPDDGCMWNAPRVGCIYSCGGFSTELFVASGKNNMPYMEVEAVDGLFIATQYDIEWREDIFTGWDFYDASQSMEFRKAGYKVIVPYMDKPWVIHDDGFLNLQEYEKYRKIYISEYK